MSGEGVSQPLGFSTYCLATEDSKCRTCQHKINWDILNEFSDIVRLGLQNKMRRLNEEVCSDTDNSLYQSRISKE